MSYFLVKDSKQTFVGEYHWYIEIDYEVLNFKRDAYREHPYSRAKIAHFIGVYAYRLNVKMRAMFDVIIEHDSVSGYRFKSREEAERAVDWLDSLMVMRKMVNEI